MRAFSVTGRNDLGPKLFLLVDINLLVDMMPTLLLCVLVALQPVYVPSEEEWKKHVYSTHFVFLEKNCVLNKKRTKQNSELIFLLFIWKINT